MQWIKIIVIINTIGKILFTFLMIGLMFFQVTRSLVILSWYELYKEEITASYCININKPELMCNGKCHINKLLEVDVDNNESSKILSKTNPNNGFYISEFTFLPLALEDITWKVTSPRFVNHFHGVQICDDIEHPPQV